MSALTFLMKFRAGEAVTAAVIGNSVGQGSQDTGFAILPSLQQTNRKFTVPNMENSAANGAYSSLREHMKSINPASRVINFSGNGWDTNDHRGISLPSSSVPGPTDTVAEILALSPFPDIVFMPLQVNDPNHGLTLATFTTNTNAMIDGLQAAGIPVVLVKENYTSITGYAAFVTQVDVIAAAKNCAVIDTNTPFGSGSGLMSDYAHPNHAGTDLIFQILLDWMYADLSLSIGVAFGLSAARAKYVPDGPLRVKAPGSNLIATMDVDDTTRIINIKTSLGVKGVLS